MVYLFYFILFSNSSDVKRVSEQGGNEVPFDGI